MKDHFWLQWMMLEIYLFYMNYFVKVHEKKNVTILKAAAPLPATDLSPRSLNFGRKLLSPRKVLIDRRQRGLLKAPNPSVAPSAPYLLQISSKFSQIFWKFAKLCEVSPLFRLCLRSDPEESVGIHPSWSGWQLSPRPLSISWLQISQNPPAVAPHPAPSGRSLRNGARHWKPLFFATILVTLASVLSALSLSSRCHKGSTMNRQQGIDPISPSQFFPGVRDRMGMLSRVWSRRGCLHQLPQPRLLCFLSQLDFSRRWGEFILKQKCSSSK